MAHCTQCNRAFPKGQVIQSAWLGYRNLKCRSCGTVHEHTILNKFIAAAIAVFAVVVAYLFDDYYRPGGLTFLVAAVLMVGLTTLSTLIFTFKRQGT
jgi:CXXC-20-CXXC protein